MSNPEPSIETSLINPNDENAFNDVLDEIEELSDVIDEIKVSNDIINEIKASSDIIDEIKDEQNPCSYVSYNMIIEDNYGTIKDDNGKFIKVTKYTLTNEQKVVIEIINYGATVISCWVPNALGELDDILLGFDSIEDYRLRNTYSIGSTLGRVTDYISNGHFKDEKGEINELSKNRGSHHFNGGERGFDKVMWDGFITDDELVLTYTSRDGEEGYPGTFQVRKTFRLTCKNELIINYVGMTSKPTPVNISSNLFFNLAGHNAGESEIMNHSLMVNANEYVAINIPERRPVGLLKNVQRTCLDLQVPRLLKKAFPLIPGYGYNHTFKLFKGKERKAFNLAASLVHKPSGRILDIYTDMPCVFINTAQDFPSYGKMVFKEEITNVTEIATPIAKFTKNDPEASSISGEYKSVSELELPVDEQEEIVTETSSSQTNHNVQENRPIIGKSHTVYKKNSGICIRPQLFPDAVTYDKFNIILKPSKFYSQRVIYKFDVISN